MKNPSKIASSFLKSLQKQLQSIFSSTSFMHRAFNISLGITILIGFHILAVYIKRLVVHMFQYQTRHSTLIVSEETVSDKGVDIGKQSNDMVYDFMGSVVYWILMLVGLVIVLKLVGIETTSMIAVLGTAGFAVGLAMQGVLNDLSSGILLSIGGDFGIGDLIEVDGIVGTVQKFNLLYTTVLHNDTYHMVKIPNRQVYGSILHNHTKLPRSVLITVMVGNDNKQFEGALREVERVLQGIDGVLPVPPPNAQVAKIHAYGTDVEVRVTIRPELFPNAKNYNFMNTLTERIRQTLVDQGLSMGSPYYATQAH